MKVSKFFSPFSSSSVSSSSCISHENGNVVGRGESGCLNKIVHCLRIPTTAETTRNTLCSAWHKRISQLSAWLVVRGNKYAADRRVQSFYTLIYMLFRWGCERFGRDQHNFYLLFTIPCFEASVKMAAKHPLSWLVVIAARPHSRDCSAHKGQVYILDAPTSQASHW